MKTSKHIFYFVLIFFGALAIGIGALLVVQAIPSTNLQKNAATALAVFEKAGIQRPSLAKNLNAMRVDYYGDAHMYQLSFGVPGATAWTNALYPHSYFEPDHPDALNNVQEVAGLKARLQGTPADADNGRYWNGFIIPMKIFGSVFSYSGLRIFNIVLLAALFIVAVILLGRMLGWSYAICFFLSLIIMWVWVVPFCLEYLSVFYIMGAGVVAILWLAKKGKLIKWGPETFLILGILTAYFDLFTAPLVTLGFPLVVAVLCLLRSQHRSDFGYVAKRVLLWTGVWLAGFAGFWAVKIVMTQALFGQGVLADAGSRFGVYTGVEGNMSLLYTIFGLAFPANLGNIFGTKGQDVRPVITSAWINTIPSALLLCAPPAVAALLARLRKKRLGAAWTLPLIALFPFLRMMVTAVHTGWNSFFTFRELGVAFFACFVFCAYLLTLIRRTKNG